MQMRRNYAFRVPGGRQEGLPACEREEKAPEGMKGRSSLCMTWKKQRGRREEAGSYMEAGGGEEEVMLSPGHDKSLMPLRGNG